MRFIKLISSIVSSTLCISSVNSQSVVQVLGASSKQTIDGFGSSLAFMGEAIHTLPATPRAAILQTLFSTVSGAGFSILRTRVSPYISNVTGHYDYTTDTEEVGTRYLVNVAKQWGVSRFLATAWTPPIYSKTNHDYNGGFIDNSATSFSNYANFLTNYVKTYNQTFGIKWYAISPQNEPEIQTEYESCQWAPVDFVNFLGTYLRPRFQAAGITTLILAPESNEWQEATIAPTLNNATSRAAVQIVAAHPYFAGEIDVATGKLSRLHYFCARRKAHKQVSFTDKSTFL
jgi:O-glycosyl hydrolase